MRDVEGHRQPDWYYRWVLGERFSSVDIYLFMLTTWLRPSRGQPKVSEFPNVKRIADAVQLRESVQKVYKEWITGDTYGY